MDKKIARERRECLTGRKFGLLTVKSFAYVSKGGQAYWNCQCDCGNTVIKRASHLKDRNVPSCGCRKGNTVHGKSKTRLYTIYSNMIARCYKPYSHEFKTYGARGIKVCDEWKSDFVAFYNWAINNGYQDNLSIDRINNDGNYEPLNCKWSTPREQANNTRKTRYITYGGKTISVSEWARALGMHQSTLNMRINKYHWPIERALTEEVRNYGS